MKNKKRFYIRGDDTPLTFEEWCKNKKNLEKGSYLIIQSRNGGILVSTVFLGVDHNYFGKIPILYETMVFGGEFDRESKRYHTEKEALVGHTEFLEKLQFPFIDIFYAKLRIIYYITFMHR